MWPIGLPWKFAASDIVNEQALEECAPLKTSDNVVCLCYY
jgi:hypothetical protein